MTIYADTSFVAPLYAIDVHSQESRRRMASKPIVWLTSFIRAELAHAIYRQVFRARISEAGSALAWRDFEQDCIAGVWIPVELPEQIWETGIGLARRHGPTLGMRTLDSLHVACALELKAQRFWTFDERQARLAEAAGLDTTA